VAVRFGSLSALWLSSHCQPWAWSWAFRLHLSRTRSHCKKWTFVFFAQYLLNYLNTGT